MVEQRFRFPVRLRVECGYTIKQRNGRGFFFQGDDMSKKIKLPSISKVKKALHDDWALRVKQRDGWKCLLCGGEELLTAHHWYFTSQRGHAARYCIDNGATLCFTCHIREVHENPGFATIDAVRRAVVAKSPAFNENNICTLKGIEVTTELLRSMWDKMRERVIPVDDMDISEWCVRGSKFFMAVSFPHPIAVVGNVVQPRGLSKYEVTVVTPFGSDAYRYTLKRLPK